MHVVYINLLPEMYGYWILWSGTIIFIVLACIPYVPWVRRDLSLRELDPMFPAGLILIELIGEPPKNAVHRSSQCVFRRRSANQVNGETTVLWSAYGRVLYMRRDPSYLYDEWIELTDLRGRNGITIRVSKGYVMEIASFGPSHSTRLVADLRREEMISVCSFVERVRMHATTDIARHTSRSRP